MKNFFAWAIAGAVVALAGAALIRFLTGRPWDQIWEWVVLHLPSL